MALLADAAVVRRDRRRARPWRADLPRAHGEPQRDPRAPPQRPCVRAPRSARAVAARRQSVALILFTLIIPIEVIYAKESLGTTSAGFGVLLASWGAGIVARQHPLRRRARSLASRLHPPLHRRHRPRVSRDGGRAEPVRGVPAVRAGGAGNGIQWVSVMTALQEATPADYQARVVGLLESALAAMPGVGYLMGGVLTAVASPPDRVRGRRDRHARPRAGRHRSRSAPEARATPHGVPRITPRPRARRALAVDRARCRCDTGDR